MDASVIAVSAHSMERILAVLLGGLAVYYGFRLFLVVPVETQSDGKIQLPGVSVVLVKAGPGLFFGLFGVLVIISSLMRPIKVTPGGGYIGSVASQSPPNAEPGFDAPRRTATEQDRQRVRLDLQNLNCMQRLSAKGTRGLPARDMELTIRNGKLALLESVWDSAGWGDWARFKQWASGEASGTTGVAKTWYEAEKPGCSE